MLCTACGMSVESGGCGAPVRRLWVVWIFAARLLVGRADQLHGAGRSRVPPENPSAAGRLMSAWGPIGRIFVRRASENDDGATRAKHHGDRPRPGSAVCWMIRERGGQGADE